MCVGALEWHSVLPVPAPWSVEGARIRASYLTKWPRADSIWFGEAIGSHCVTMNGETAILLPYDSYKLEYAGCGTRR